MALLPEPVAWSPDHFSYVARQRRIEAALAGSRCSSVSPRTARTRHTTQLEELDVDGVLAFAGRVLPKAADMWVQASLDQRQRLQQLFFPDGVPFDGKRFSRTRVNAAAFSYIRPVQQGDESLVAQIFTSWNPLTTWLRHIDGLRAAA